MKKSIVKVGYATFTVDEETGKYTYAPIKYFESDKSGGREHKATPRGELTEVYADGVVVLSHNENDGYDHTLQLLDLVDDIDKDWLGNTVADDGSGVAEYSTGAEFPKFALVIVHTQVNAPKKYLVDFYYETQVTARPDKSSKTSEGKFEAAFLDLSLKTLPREHDDPAKRLVTYSYRTDEMPKSIILPGEVTTTGTSA